MQEKHQVLRNRYSDETCAIVRRSISNLRKSYYFSTTNMGEARKIRGGDGDIPGVHSANDGKKTTASHHLALPSQDHLRRQYQIRRGERDMLWEPHLKSAVSIPA